MLKNRRQPTDSERGIALIAVLWAVTILSLVAILFMRESRVELSIVRNLTENAKAEALAEAGVTRAMLGLLATDDTAWRIDGAVYRLDFPEGAVRLTLQDEGGKIDLNRASPAMLRNLLRSVGVAADRAEALADAVADFRDRDDLARVSGAEDNAYEAAGLSVGAKDAPLATVDEVMQVLGMTRDLFERIEPLVTVYSTRPDVNFATAPAGVLRVLPNITDEQLAQILAAREAVDAAGGARALTAAVNVRAEATTKDGGRFIREVVLRGSTDPTRAFDILAWRQRWDGAAPESIR